MSDLTAMGQVVASEDSKLAFVPLAPNVCLTPAAPSPVPVPYPIQGDTGKLEGGCETVLHHGTPTMNTHGKIAAVHGNEAGSVGDVVTGTTGGTAWATSGAPTVLFEGAPAVTATSPGFGNCR
jgi:hypothetical protein